MPFTPSPTSSSPASAPSRARRRRPALLTAAFLLVAGVGLAAPLTASAAPAASVDVIGTTMSPYGALQVTGVTGFTPDEALTFLLDGVDVTNQLVVTTTESTGDITQVLGNLHFTTDGGGSVGSHTLTATDASASQTASVSLTVIPSPVPSPATITRTVAQMRSTGVTVRFDGFLPGETVTVGMASQVNGSPCGAPLVADATGSVTATCVWDAAYAQRFGSTPAAGEYIVGANNAIFTIYSDAAQVVVAAPTPPPAAPAVPVEDDATFTG